MDESVVISVEETVFSLQDKNLVHVKLNVMDQENESVVEFDFNMLEETALTVATDLINELNLSKHSVEYAARQIQTEVDRVKNQRDMAELRFLLSQVNPPDIVKPDESEDSKSHVLFRQFVDLVFQSNMLKPNTSLLTRSDLFIIAPICFLMGFTKEAKIFYKRYLDFKVEQTHQQPSNLTLSQIVEIPLPSTSSPLQNKDDGNSPEELYSMTGLAKVYAKQSKWDKSEALLKSVLILCQTRQRHPWDEDEHSSTSSTPVTERYASNTSIGEEVTWKSILGFHMLEEDARKTLVQVYENQNKLIEAEMLYKRMYEDLNAAIKSRDRKAEKFINEGKFVEAQTLLKDVYKLKENGLPILDTLAELYIRHNKLNDALECFKSCLEIKEKLNDPEHFSVAETLNRIAQMQKQLTKMHEAEETLQRALKICEKALNTNENAHKFYCTRPKEEQDTHMPSVVAKNIEIRKVLLLSLSNYMIVLNELNKQNLVPQYKKRLSEVAQGLESVTNKS